MRVSNAGPGKGVSDVNRKKRSGDGAAGSDFSKELLGVGEPESAPPVVDVAPAHPVDSILAVQEVGDATDHRDRQAARRYGEAILDRLERIRVDLLTGSVSKDRLAELAREVRAQRANTADPRLQRILDEIDLRARVEIAKFTREA